MLVKKVVAYGNSSYCIVLPKEYMDFYGILPGDLLAMEIKECRHTS